jgi:hypothetical protein
LRAIDAIQVIGEASAGLNCPALFQILTYASWMIPGEILSPQDTKHDAEEFRARGGVKPLESGLISLATAAISQTNSAGVSIQRPQIAIPHRFDPGGVENLP